MSELWEIRKFGRPPAFDSPQEMWDRAVVYFKWCKENQLVETKAFSFQGEATYGYVPHMRAMTLEGLCAHLNIGVSTWHDYKKKPDFSDVTEAIQNIMTEQKFTGAAAGFLNANIIARDLGIDKFADNDDTEAQALNITFEVKDPVGDVKITEGKSDN